MERVVFMTMGAGDLNFFDNFFPVLPSGVFQLLKLARLKRKIEYIQLLLVLTGYSCGHPPKIFSKYEIPP